MKNYLFCLLTLASLAANLAFAQAPKNCNRIMDQILQLNGERPMDELPRLDLATASKKSLELGKVPTFIAKEITGYLLISKWENGKATFTAANNFDPEGTVQPGIADFSFNGVENTSVRYDRFCNVTGVSLDLNRDVARRSTLHILDLRDCHRMRDRETSTDLKKLLERTCQGILTYKWLPNGYDLPVQDNTFVKKPVIGQ